MTGARRCVALAGWLVVGPLVACHSAGAQKKGAAVDRIAPDTARVIFTDTAVSAFAPPDARDFDLRRPAHRDSLRALLVKQRALWRTKQPPSYRFLQRIACFCPGQRGWLLIETRKGQPLRAFDRTGRAVALDNWSTLDIDSLFVNLQRSVDRNNLVLIAFDPRRHFPSYVRTVTLPGPDAWSIVEVRGFRPL